MNLLAWRFREIIYIKGGGKYPSIDAYFKANPNSPLNSEATSLTGYGDYKSFAEVVGKELTKQGLNVEKKSWVLARTTNGQNKSYTLYLTDKKITTADSGTTVACTKYDAATGNIESGIVAISLKDGYPIINMGTFPDGN